MGDLWEVEHLPHSYTFVDSYINWGLMHSSFMTSPRYNHTRCSATWRKFLRGTSSTTSTVLGDVPPDAPDVGRLLQCSVRMGAGNPH